AVDDVEANLLVVSGLLAPYKVTVDTASNGIDAIAALKKNKYDLVFMDHMMPGMDGIETTRAIRDLKEDTVKDIPIIAFTANAVSGMKEMFLSNGLNDFISKPIEINELNRIMYKWVPKEKHQSLSQKTEVKLKPPGGINSVEGIDVERGLNRFGGKTAIYEKILLSFATSLDENIKSLSDLYDNGKYSDLRAGLHALKGMTGSVECSELYTLSTILEAAAKEENYDYVDENLPDFMEKAKKVQESIILNLTKN
ncbi:MAG: response regulator, partial [Clostridiales bacterium]|nr:response regulator [Clostridiales bacterium]